MVSLPRLLAGSFASVLFVAMACQRPSGEPVQSPKSDSLPPPQTSDGRVVGADNKSPSQTLAEQGTTAHPAPGWKVGPNGVSYDPKRQPGGPESGSTKLVRPDGGVEEIPSHE